MSFPMIAMAMKSAFAAIGTYGSAIQAGLALGTTALSYGMAAGQASAVASQNRQANERARRYMIEDYDNMTRREQQEVAVATQKIQENQITARQTAASAQVAASSGGVSGLSVDALLTDIFGQEASIRDNVNQNLEGTMAQSRNERASIRRAYETQVNTRPLPNRPSLLGAALEAGTGLVDAYKDQWKVRGSRGTRT